MKADNNLFHHPSYSYSLPLRFFLFIFLLSLSSPPSSANGLLGDAQQLLSFKNSLPYPDHLPNWQPTISPCNFHGVSCNNNSRVSSIDLSNHLLDADFFKVASFLLSLQNLESLVLKNANISGAISSAPRFSCSGFLNSLDLAENAISGPVTDISAFGVCPALVSLNLSRNLVDLSVKEVAKGSGLSSLHVLDVSYNKISGENVVSWLLSDDEFSELQQLSLKGNKVGGSVPELNLKNLMYLDLSLNNFSTKFPTFGDCSNLQYLDLSSNKFSGDVGDSLSTCLKLSFLNLTSNKLTGPVPKLPSGSIQFLYLQENYFQNIFPASVSDLCTTLVELDLSFNNLTGNLPQELASCSVLEVLDVSGNSFSGEFPIDTLLNLSNLKTFVDVFQWFSG
ncbi:UNVERIFIED_CONTAM: Systemin receptor [Sesamum calycinum]|uniref:Systemin receptor n=1 Tax=Sesamum calycinum TaxID=2727403 RepID=A0AAW2ST40_9LAMI